MTFEILSDTQDEINNDSEYLDLEGFGFDRVFGDEEEDRVRVLIKLLPSWMEQLRIISYMQCYNLFSSSSLCYPPILLFLLAFHYFSH